MNANPRILPTLAGRGKAMALLEAREAWVGQRIWATARNRLIATEIGRLDGIQAENALSMEMLRDQIAKGQGPAAGDVLVVDEFSLLDRADVDLLLDLAHDGVDVEAL